MKATNEDESPVRPMKLVELSLPPVGPVGHAYSGPGGLHVIAAREEGIWHISVSTRYRYPTWDEMRDVAWALQPARSFKVVIPSRDAPYTNWHNYCLHMWEDKP